MFIIVHVGGIELLYTRETVLTHLYPFTPYYAENAKPPTHSGTLSEDHPPGPMATP